MLIFKNKNIIKKRKKIFIFLYSIFRIKLNDEIIIRDELLLELLKNLEKEAIKMLIFIPSNFINKKEDNLIYILLWKKSILKIEKDINEKFEKIIANLNIIFNYNLEVLEKREIERILYEFLPFL